MFGAVTVTLRRGSGGVALASAALLGAAAISPGAAAAAASPWQDHEVVAVRLVAGAPAPDGELRLGLHFRLSPGWHVYWKHGGDAGLPPIVELTGDRPVTGTRILFPAPTRYRLPGGLVALGYSGEVVYPLRARPASAEAPRRLQARVDFLACEDECIPFHDELEIELGSPDRERHDPAASENATPPATERLLAAWEARLPQPVEAVPELRVTATMARNGDAGELELTLAGASAAEDLFFEPMAGLEGEEPSREIRPGSVTFRVPLHAEVAGSWPAATSVAWTATGVTSARDGGAHSAIGVEGVVTATAAVARPAAAPAASSALSGFSASVASLPFPLRGALLAFTPGSLAILLLLAMGPRMLARREAAMAASAAGTALAGALALAVGAGRLAGVAMPLAEPLALGLLALPALLLVLALWSGGGEALRGAPPALLGAIAALLALPWAAWLLPPPWSPGGLALAAVAFALPVAAAALVPGSRPATPPRLHGVLGFLAAATLLWVSHRLATALLRHEVAFVQVAWLGAALGTRLAASHRGARRAFWAGLAAAAAASSLWLLVR